MVASNVRVYSPQANELVSVNPQITGIYYILLHIYQRQGRFILEAELQQNEKLKRSNPMITHFLSIFNKKLVFFDHRFCNGDSFFQSFDSTNVTVSQLN
jgi:hypothetical protein